MEKYITWFLLFLKAKVRTAGFYMELLAMCALILLVSHITLPDADNTTVGILCGDSEAAKRIFDKMEAASGLFVFVTYGDEAKMAEAVKRGELECAFAFSEDFDTCCRTGDVSESVICYVSASTTKGNVLQESLYAAFAEVYSEHILGDALISLYGTADEERQALVMERFREYVDSEDVFGVVLCGQETEQPRTEEGRTVQPVLGCVGLLLSLFMYMTLSKKWEDGFGFPRALPKREAAAFWLVAAAANTAGPAVLGFALILGSGQSRGFFAELGGLALFLGYSLVWMILFSKIWKSHLAFLASIPILVAAKVLICPIFFDIVEYIPAVKYIRMLFPLGFYLGKL